MAALCRAGQAAQPRLAADLVRHGTQGSDGRLVGGSAEQPHHGQVDCLRVLRARPVLGRRRLLCRVRRTPRRCFGTRTTLRRLSVPAH
eukprot:1741182-Prymnesium_polylepis.1